MYSTKDQNFVLFALATLCIFGYGVSSWEDCPEYIPFFCACEMTDEGKSTLINICSYEIEGGIEDCKPCPSEHQDYANCTSCPGKTCPVCAHDNHDLETLKRNVSLDEFEDLKTSGKIVIGYSFKATENSSVIYRTGEDETKNATEDDQNMDEQTIYDENQTRSSVFIEEDPSKSGLQFSEENQTSRNKNATEEDQNSSKLESLDQDRNTTDEDYGSGKVNDVGLKEKNDSIPDSTKQQQNDQISHDQQFEMEANLNRSLNYSEDKLTSEKYEDEGYRGNEDDEMFTEGETEKSSETEIDSDTYIASEALNKSLINDDENLKLDQVKVWFSGERYPSEQNTPVVKIIEDNGNKSTGMNESFSLLPDQGYRQSHLQTEMPENEFKGEEVQSSEEDKTNDSQSLLINTKETPDNLESNNSSTSTKEISNDSYSNDSTVDGKTLSTMAFIVSPKPGETYFLRGGNSQNDSLSQNSPFRSYEDKLQPGNNNSRNVLNDEIKSSMAIEKESKSSSFHPSEAADKNKFSKNNYVKDVINHVFYGEGNSPIQTLAFDVIFVNYLKYSTAMPDLTTFYFIADLSPEEKLNISLVRICFLNEKYSRITADELNLCRKEMVPIPDSSSLLTVRIQNSHIFKENYFNAFFEGNGHGGKNQELFKRSSLTTDGEESGIFNGHDYKLLRNGAKKFVQDNFEFIKIYDLWEMSRNESSVTFRFCHDINYVRVCKNYEDDISVHIKIDDRYHVFVSAFLNSATLFDLHVAHLIRMQLSKHSYLTSNINSEPEEKEDTHQNEQVVNFSETFASTASYDETGDKGDGSEGISVNLTEGSQYDSGNDKTFLSYANSNEKAPESGNLSSSEESNGNEMDMYRSKTAESMNLSSSADLNENVMDRSKTLEGMNISSTEGSTASNFSVETGDTDEVLLTTVNDATEEVPSETYGSVTDDIEENKSELERDNVSRRFRRTINSAKLFPVNWCDYTKLFFNGTIECIKWTYKKECTIKCYPGYDISGETTKEFTCQRKTNVWVPELEPCLKSSSYTNINERLSWKGDTDEDMKSGAKKGDTNEDEKVSTGPKGKGHNLISNYHPNDFNFDNYAYDKDNYDSPNVYE